jgi:hypothetical protein
MGIRRFENNPFIDEIIPYGMEHEKFIGKLKLKAVEQTLMQRNPFTECL